MAVLGKLKDLSIGKPNPYYRDGKQDGYILVPKEFLALRDVASDSVVWYFHDVKASKEYEGALQFDAMGDLIQTEVTFRVVYGMRSGFLSIKVNTDFGHVMCYPRKGYAMSDFIDLISSDARTIYRFCLDCGKLNRAQRDLLLRRVRGAL
jgi:hypothetical protein